MRLKSYYSRTVEDAIATARQELGPDAMLVNSRRSLPEAKHMGEYEVVFVTEAPAAVETEAIPAPAAHSSTAKLSAEFSEFKRELEAVRRALTRTAYATHDARGGHPEALDAYSSLTAAELTPELARAIVDAACDRGGPMRSTKGSFAKAVLAELRSRIRTESVLGRGGARPQIVALVGPPGAGKTTTLVKLAVTYGLAGRRPPLLLSMDTYRIAAADQLRSYGTILGVGCLVLDTVTALAQAIEENRGKELILIDTPGFAFSDLDMGAPLAQFLATRKDIDTHLVLPASMKSADLARVVQAYEVFAPGRFLFTRADETVSFGNIVGESLRAGRPVSFLATGQRIPEDLEVASPDRLAELVFSCGASAEPAAA